MNYFVQIFSTPLHTEMPGLSGPHMADVNAAFPKRPPS